MTRRILFLEHDDDDVYITRTFFSELGSDVNLQVVSSPEEAESTLESMVQSGSGLPDIMLIDYNAIPENAGRFIGRLKSNRLYQMMPLIVLRGTSDPSIVRECYQHGAASFIEKPADSEAIKRKISALLEYWFTCVALP